jgi:F-type H+-transporting ATPase subunit b
MKSILKLLTQRMYLLPIILMALAVFAPELMAAGAAPGEIGDHHAPTDQKEVLHFSGALMFWEYLTFGIVLVILGAVVFPKLLKQLDARQMRVRDALDKADQVRAEAEVLLKKHEEMMRNAQQDAKKITDQAAVAAREVASRIQAEAEAAAKETRERAAREIDQLKVKAEAELRAAAVDLALLASGRILQHSLTGEDHRRLAEEAVTAVSAMRN